VPRIEAWLPVPGRGILALTREHRVDTSRRAEYTRWTATSRIDLVSGAEKARVIYTRGTRTDGHPPVPDQKIIVQDANAGTVMVNFSDHPEALEILRRSMYSAAVLLKPGPRVLLILAQLAAALLLSALLIAAPLGRLPGARHAGAGGFLVYFASVGLGFIMIEIGMMQKLTVFLGHPIYSLTVTLASVLLFAGLGSLVSQGWFRAAPARAAWVPAGLAVFVGAFLLAWPALVGRLVGLPLAARIAIAVAILAPVSLLLGVPFAYGIRRASERSPQIVPWAWGVNGCASVVGSIATVILSMAVGFAATLAIAAGIYALAFASLLARR
jgi:hypothetical protein